MWPCSKRGAHARWNRGVGRRAVCAPWPASLSAQKARPGGIIRPFWAAATTHVDPPVAHPQRLDAQRAHPVHHEQRRMAGGVDGGPHGCQVGDRPGGRLGVHDAHVADPVRRVGRQDFGDLGRVGRALEMLRRGHHVVAEVAGHHRPALAEQPAVGDQHRVARVEGVGQRRLPGAVAHRGQHHDRVGPAEHAGQFGPDAVGQRDEVGVGEVDGRATEGLQHPVRDVGRPRILDEVPPGGAHESSCAARDSTESMNSSMISYTTWALALGLVSWCPTI